MSDVSYTLQLPEARLESIDRDADTITLRLSRAFLVQEMENAFEDSLWTQAMNLSIRDYSLDGELPDCPCEIGGGDMTNNIYTYRDHAPLRSHGPGPGVSATWSSASTTGWRPRCSKRRPGWRRRDGRRSR